MCVCECVRVCVHCTCTIMILSGAHIIYTSLTGVGSSSKSSGEGDLGSGQVGTSCILALLSIRLKPYLQNKHKLQFIDCLKY